MGKRQEVKDGQKTLSNYQLPTVYSLLPIIFFLLYSCSTLSVQLNSKPILIDKVPFYPQEDYQCGPASLAGVLNYWGISVTPEEIAKEIYSASAKGTLNIDMLIYANKKGIHALQYAGGWDDLKTKINNGYPMIVLVDYGFSLYQANHFMVVIGYNGDGVIANSGKTEKMFIDKGKFLKAWKKTNYWTLLIKQKSEVSPPPQADQKSDYQKTEPRLSENRQK